MRTRAGGWANDGTRREVDCTSVVLGWRRRGVLAAASWSCVYFANDGVRVAGWGVGGETERGEVVEMMDGPDVMSREVGEGRRMSSERGGKKLAIPRDFPGYGEAAPSIHSKKSRVPNVYNFYIGHMCLIARSFQLRSHNVSGALLLSIHISPGKTTSPCNVEHIPNLHCLCLAKNTPILWHGKHSPHGS